MFLTQEMTAQTERKYDHKNNQSNHHGPRIEVQGPPRLSVGRRRPRTQQKVSVSQIGCTRCIKSHMETNKRHAVTAGRPSSSQQIQPSESPLYASRSTLFFLNF